MDKTTFTSGTETFRAYDEDGVLYNGQRIIEYIPLRVNSLSQGVPKRVTLLNAQITTGLKFLQLRVNKTNFQNANVTIKIYRGNNFIDSITLPDSYIPFQFPDGTVVNPRGLEGEDPIELEFTASKNLDELYIICQKVFVEATVTLIEPA